MKAGSLCQLLFITYGKINTATVHKRQSRRPVILCNHCTAVSRHTYEENRLYFLYFPSFTASKNVFAGLNAGTW